LRQVSAHFAAADIFLEFLHPLAAFSPENEAMEIKPDSYF
jgi:hypothetical protein